VSDRQPDEQARENAFGRRILPHGWPLLSDCPLAAQPAEDVITWEGLAVAVALMSARLSGIRLGHADLAADVPATTVLAGLLVLAAAIVRQELGDEGGLTMMRALGLLAASEGAEPAAA
jgi:hypothetical protein